MTEEFLTKLVSWYRERARDLPWRGNPSPYEVLVSEVMLQQTTVAAVIPLYLRWMERFPSLGVLAQASPEEVLSYWSGLGYYSRAERLHRVAQLICSQESFPNTYEDLLALEGVGPYTAAAVASLAFHRPCLALDTNVTRVLLRVLGWTERADTRSVQQGLRKAVEPLLGDRDSGEVNQAFMELGATVCTARGASCRECPVRLSCRALRLGLVEQIPQLPRKAPIKVTPGTALLIYRDQQLLLLRGTSLGLLKNLFQPPLLLSDDGAEHPLQRFAAGFREHLGQPSGSRPTALKYRISGRLLALGVDIYRLQSDQQLQEALPEAGLEWHWFSVEALSTGEAQAVSSLTRKLAEVGREILSNVRC